MSNANSADQEAARHEQRARREMELRVMFCDVQGGNTKAFARLVAVTRPKLLAAIRRIYADRDEAEDILQDVYLKAWSACATFDGIRGGVEQWLLGIARNSAIDRVRTRARRPRFAQNMDDECPYAAVELDQPGPVESAFRGECSAAVRACLMSLDVAQRRVLMLSFWDELSHDEIARTTGCPLGTVKSWVRRSMLSMREALAPYAIA